MQGWSIDIRAFNCATLGRSEPSELMHCTARELLLVMTDHIRKQSPKQAASPLLSAVLSSVHHLGTHALQARIGKVVGNPVVNTRLSLTSVRGLVLTPPLGTASIEFMPQGQICSSSRGGRRANTLTPKAQEKGKQQFVFTCRLCSTLSLLHSSLSELLPNPEHGCPQSSVPGCDG